MRARLGGGGPAAILIAASPGGAANDGAIAAHGIELAPDRRSVRFAVVGADPRRVLPRLAQLTGDRLHNAEALADAPPITVHGRHAVGVAAWSAVLAQLHATVVCAADGCDVWLLRDDPTAAAGATATATPVSPVTASAVTRLRDAAARSAAARAPKEPELDPWSQEETGN